jgi:transposase
MKPTELNALPDDVTALKQLVLEQQARWEQAQSEWSKQSQIYQETIRLLRHQRFGKSSEKDPGQGELFDEVEQLAEEPAIEEIELAEKDSLQASDAKTRVKASSGRKPLPKQLPRVVREHDIPEAEKTCNCGCQKTYIGDQVSEQLDIIPATIQVIEHRRKKYVCQGCKTSPQTAPMPAQPIPKSNASSGLLAYVVTSKFQDALPLYRQEAIFKRLDIHLPRNTLATWMLKLQALAQPIYNLLQDRLLTSGYIHMDETTVQVLKEPGKAASTKSYMWVRKTGDPDQQVVLFDYEPTRSAAVVDKLLGDYQGYLQTDDYKGYHAFGQRTGAELLACWAHVRRKFIEAEKVANTPKGKIGKAGMGVQLIKKLYAIEQRIQSLNPEEKKQIRQQDSQAQMDKIEKWLQKSLQTTLPKSRLGQALGYLQTNWNKLQVYLTDGRLNIDNNPVENAIRPFVIGRKNWIFSASQNGAKASAMMYSIIETAKANGLEPYQYLKYLFEQLPMANSLEDYEQLLPWNVRF